VRIISKSMNDAYRKACQALYLHGNDVVTRDLKVRELTNVQIELSDPTARLITSKARDVDMRYMVGELCFFLGGSTDLEQIAFYSSFWRKVSDDGKTVNSAYGERLFYSYNPETLIQFDYAIRCLEQDEFSRKAVMPIYRTTDAKTSKDNPCTMFLQLMIRDDHLDCYAFMRSNDIWLGLPYDVAFFTLIQEIAFVQLKLTYPFLQMGRYYHHATSLHCYDNHIDALWDIKREVGLRPARMPEVSDGDVFSWFTNLLQYERSYRAHRHDAILMPGIQGWLAQWLK